MALAWAANQVRRTFRSASHLVCGDLTVCQTPCKVSTENRIRLGERGETALRGCLVGSAGIDPLNLTWVMLA